MPEPKDNKAKVINKSGTLKMTDAVAAKKETRDIAGRRMNRGNRRRSEKRRVGKECRSRWSPDH